ncbi:MAG: hypothetical protein KDK62_06735 [Chlamydiia bacterium]|nr:hypothetical protein [Chlamydiia bacterium]
MGTPQIDWMTIQVSLPGLTDQIYARHEYTLGAVAQKYNEELQVIAQIYNKINDPSLTPPSDIDAADVAAVSQAIANLYDLAQNGIADDNGRIWYLNTEMASNLDLLSKSLISAGFAVPGIPGTTNQVEALRAWKDLSALSPVITDLLRVGLDTFNSNRTLQALIELEYVKTGNELIETQMGELEEALGLTADTLEALAALQDLHNKIQVTSRGGLEFDYLADYGNGKQYVNAYNSAASGYFGDQISPILGFTLVSEFVYGPTSFYYPPGSPLPIPTTPLLTVKLGQEAENYVNQLISLRNSITSQIARLDQTLSAEQKAGAGNIFSALTTVLADLNAIFVDQNGNPITATSTNEAKGNAIAAWLIDRYDDPDAGSQQGAIQGNITKAITSAQSLNDTQKQDVKNYLFVFEEYYKSASAILQKITQLLERIAQGIRS